MIVAVSALAR